MKRENKFAIEYMLNKDKYNAKFRKLGARAGSLAPLVGLIINNIYYLATGHDMSILAFIILYYALTIGLAAVAGMIYGIYLRVSFNRSHQEPKVDMNYYLGIPKPPIKVDDHLHDKIQNAPKYTMDELEEICKEDKNE